MQADEHAKTALRVSTRRHAVQPHAELHKLAFSNDPREVLARSPSEMGGFALAVLPIPASCVIHDDHHSTPRIYVAHAGLGRRCYRRGLRTLDLCTAPRMIEIYEAGLHFERSVWNGEAGRCAEVRFPDADVQAMTGGDLQALNLETRHEVFDERVSSLVFQLADEVLAGLPSGPLYARGIGLALLGLLVANHSGQSPSIAAAGRALTPQQKTRVADFVAGSFGLKLSIDLMATEVHLSPFHFSRLFKASFGVTPHHYVQTVRLDAAARELQRTGDRSISDIALQCGFASQSHMTAQMQRYLGTTPASLRRGAHLQRVPGMA